MRKLCVVGIALLVIPFISRSQSQILEPQFTNADSSAATKVVAKPNPYVREADMMWAKRIWRVVDMRMKMNQPYYYPMEPQNQRINLVSLILQGIEEDKITPYDPNFGDDFQQKMDSTKALAIGTRSDTLMLPEANPPYELKPYVMTTAFDPGTVTKFKIKEDWYFDRARSVMNVRILGICPVMEVYDAESGEFKGEMEMFWIDYAEVRDYFSQYELYNMYNFGQRISYDDAFQIRLFSSTIIKEDNVYDRSIAQYMEGVDALYEAEEIKNNLMTYESDLWEY